MLASKLILTLPESIRFVDSFEHAENMIITNRNKKFLSAWINIRLLVLKVCIKLITYRMLVVRESKNQYFKAGFHIPAMGWKRWFVGGYWHYQRPKIAKASAAEPLNA
jgi:hypothetical protein